MLQMCGPTGVGFLYAKRELLSAMPPFLGEDILFMARLFIFLECNLELATCTPSVSN